MGIIITLGLIGGVWGWAIGNRKGRALDGALLGLFLGFIGVLIAWGLRPETDA